MKFGDILCLKTTGELVFVLGEPAADSENKSISVRRPTMTREGIIHSTDVFYQAELETPEEHLRHEAQEMVLKADIQEEMLTLRDAQKAEKKTDITVN